MSTPYNDEIVRICIPTQNDLAVLASFNKKFAWHTKFLDSKQVDENVTECSDVYAKQIEIDLSYINTYRERNNKEYESDSLEIVQHRSKIVKNTVKNQKTGATYETIRVGNQEWLSKSIPVGTSAKGINTCPSGFRVPTDGDYIVLEDYVKKNISTSRYYDVLYNPYLLLMDSNSCKKLMKEDNYSSLFLHKYNCYQQDQEGNFSIEATKKLSYCTDEFGLSFGESLPIVMEFDGHNENTKSLYEFLQSGDYGFADFQGFWNSLGYDLKEFRCIKGEQSESAKKMWDSLATNEDGIIRRVEWLVNNIKPDSLVKEPSEHRSYNVRTIGQWSVISKWIEGGPKEFEANKYMSDKVCPVGWHTPTAIEADSIFADTKSTIEKVGKTCYAHPIRHSSNLWMCEKDFREAGYGWIDLKTVPEKKKADDGYKYYFQVVRTRDGAKEYRVSDYNQKTHMLQGQLITVSCVKNNKKNARPGNSAGSSDDAITVSMKDIGNFFSGLFGGGDDKEEEPKQKKSAESKKPEQKQKNLSDEFIYLKPTNIKATSTSKAGSKNNYEAVNMVDEDPNTIWAAPFENKAISLSMNAGNVELSGLYIENGYWKSDKSLKDNGRVKEIILFINNQKAETLVLEDVASVPKKYAFGESGQKLMFSKTYKNVLSVNLAIRDIYPGDKWNDAAITELRFLVKRKK